MSTKFLDLDALTPVEKITIKLNDRVHEFKEMSVEDFIWTQGKTREVIDSNDASQEEILDATIEMLVRSFPTIKKDELSTLGLSKLRALNEFVTHVALQGAEKAVEQSEGASGNAPAESPTT